MRSTNARGASCTNDDGKVYIQKQNHKSRKKVNFTLKLRYMCILYTHTMFERIQKQTFSRIYSIKNLRFNELMYTVQ